MCRYVHALCIMFTMHECILIISLLFPINMYNMLLICHLVTHQHISHSVVLCVHYGLQKVHCSNYIRCTFFICFILQHSIEKPKTINNTLTNPNTIHFNTINTYQQRKEMIQQMEAVLPLCQPLKDTASESNRLSPIWVQHRTYAMQELRYWES